MPGIITAHKKYGLEMCGGWNYPVKYSKVSRAHHAVAETVHRSDDGHPRSLWELQFFAAGGGFHIQVHFFARGCRVSTALTHAPRMYGFFL